MVKKTEVTKPARGTVGKIGQEDVEKAYDLYLNFRSGKAMLEKRVTENEQWFKQRHWEVVGDGKTEKEIEAHANDPKPTSAWLFNSLANKHADAMDNYPSPNILPKEESDKEEAKMLSSIVPVILDGCKFKRTYRKNQWPKLKHGTAYYSITWDQTLENGLGNISIKSVDILNLYWEPGLSDIQKSKGVFHTEMVRNEILKELYPWCTPYLSAKGDTDQATYIVEDTVDYKDMTLVLDYYYRMHDKDTGRTILHMIKMIKGCLLYATENDTDQPMEQREVKDPETGEMALVETPIGPSLAEAGLYNHGRYPFVADILFPIEGSCAGFGFVDISKDPQMYIDKMNQIIAKNALMSGKKRFFVKSKSGINKAQFADWGNDIVEVEGQVDDSAIREFQVSPLPSFIINFQQMRIDELKETSGNRDFSQGSTSGGVTAASAIAALQAAGDKLSRDMNDTSYDSYEEITELVIELIAQFYTEPRIFRITQPNGSDQFIPYDNTNIREQEMLDPATGEPTYRKPNFDIKIVAERKSPFNRISQNELAKELFSMGLFNPEMADQAMIVLDMMEFDGKDEVVSKVQQNQQLIAMVQKLQNALGMMVSKIDDMSGTADYTVAALQDGLIPANHPAVGKAKERMSQRMGE